jgi:hypothetical protein
MIRKRFEIVDRVVQITGKAPIGRVKKFGFVEGEIHRGEQKAPDFLLSRGSAIVE